MKLNTFVSQVLQDIESGLNEARNKSDKRYSVQTSANSGVSFDIAVTTVSESGSEAEGSAKAGFIEVLGAGVKGKINKIRGNTEVSRIKFTVYVPHQTQTESNTQIAEIRAENEERSNKLSHW